MSKTYIEEFFVAYAIKALQDGGNMTEYISDWLTDSLFSNGFIKEGDREIYHYSIQVMIEKIIGFSTIFFLAFLWEKLLETIMFVFCFSYIRKYSGGFHSRSFAGCYIGTITIYVAYVKFLYLILLRNISINSFLLVTSVVIILAIGAVNHPNMDWSEKEYRESKMLTRIVATIEISCILIFMILGMEEKYILFMSFGLVLSAVLLALGKITCQEVKRG